MLMLSIVDWVSPLLDNLNYINVAILMAIESSFIPFPSEVVVPPAAFMAAEGELNIWLVLLSATIGCLIGATINYYLALYVGRPIVYKFVSSRVGHLCLLSEEKMLRAEQYFDRHGATATIGGRLIPAIRQLISIPAGLARMNFVKFLAFTAIGAGAWNAVLCALGWYLQGVLGGREGLETAVRQYEQPIIIAILLIVVSGIAYAIGQGHKKSGKQGK